MGVAIEHVETDNSNTLPPLNPIKEDVRDSSDTRMQPLASGGIGTPSHRSSFSRESRELHQSLPNSFFLRDQRPLRAIGFGHKHFYARLYYHGLM